MIAEINVMEQRWRTLNGVPNGSLRMQVLRVDGCEPSVAPGWVLVQGWRYASSLSETPVPARTLVRCEALPAELREQLLPIHQARPQSDTESGS